MNRKQANKVLARAANDLGILGNPLTDGACAQIMEMRKIFPWELKVKFRQGRGLNFTSTHRKQLAKVLVARHHVELIASRQKKPKIRPTSQDLITRFYESWDWKRARYDFIKDKKRRCECCGATPEDGIRIVVDHIKPIRYHWHLRLEPTNFQMLCDPCNMGKGSRDETDWRTENVVEFPAPETARRMAAIKRQLGES